MKKTLLLLTILFCCASNAIAQEAIEPDEYAVYQAVLNELFINSNTKRIVISKLTSSEESNRVRQKFSRVKTETIKDYDARNLKSSELKNNFGIAPTSTLVSEEDLVPIIKKEKDDGGTAYREAFKEIYSTESMLSFSRVGFNKSKDQALIHVGYNCGPTCGEGNFVLLSRKNNRWVIRKKSRTWIA